jgi:hypothetical protein
VLTDPRTGDFFGDPHGLTLSDNLVRGQVVERAVRPTVMVGRTPSLDDELRRREAFETDARPGFSQGRPT